MKFWSNAQLGEFLQKGIVQPVQVESHTIDTGERKAFFGYPAKHFITTIKRTPDKDDKGGEETIDGWYIDHEPADLHCAPEFVPTQAMYVLGTTLTRYPEIPQFHHSGPLPTGMVVRLTRTHKESASGRTISLEETVEDLSDSPLNPSLFELPKSLHENPQLFRGKPSSGP
jgi:hypothetical protein